MSGKKAANFAKEELKTLIDECLNRLEDISNTSQGAGVAAKRRKAWETIQQAVQKVSRVERPVKKLQEKWSDYKSKAKKKQMQIRGEMRVTGGGSPPDDLDELEAKVVDGIGKVATEGIEGHVDSHVPCGPKVKGVKKESTGSPAEKSQEGLADADVQSTSEMVKARKRSLDEEKPTKVKDVKSRKELKVEKVETTVAEESLRDRYYAEVMAMKKTEHESKMELYYLKKQCYELKLQKLRGEAEKSHSLTNIETGKVSFFQALENDVY